MAAWPCQFDRDLGPAAWAGTEVEHDIAGSDQPIAGREFVQFVRCTRTITLLVALLDETVRLLALQPATARTASRHRLLVAHAEDFVFDVAARRAHQHAIAAGFANQCARKRRINRDHARLDVGLILAHDFVFDFLVGRDIA